jgi:hypothetical protein
VVTLVALCGPSALGASTAMYLAEDRCPYTRGGLRVALGILCGPSPVTAEMANSLFQHTTYRPRVTKGSKGHSSLDLTIEMFEWRFRSNFLVDTQHAAGQFLPTPLVPVRSAAQALGTSTWRSAEATPIPSAPHVSGMWMGELALPPPRPRRKRRDHIERQAST